jgi:hypothetical protein
LSRTKLLEKFRKLILKEGNLAKGDLAKEAALPEGQKIVQQVSKPREFKSADKIRSKKPVEFQEVDPSLFYKQINKVIQSDEMAKTNIHPYSVDEYKNMQTFLSKDGKSGYALKPNGELVSVHSVERGRGDDIVRHAVHQGAKKLDAFDINKKLTDLYSRHGFVEKARAPFDPKYADPNNQILNKYKPDFVEMEIPAKKMEALKKVAAISPMAGMDDFITSPAKDFANLYKNIVKKPARTIGEKTAEMLDLSKYATVPQQKEALQKVTDTARSSLGDATEIGLDPTSYFGGAGLAASIAVDALAEEEDDSNRFNALKTGFSK